MGPTGRRAAVLLDFLSILISLNISLAVFNLLPIPPFDGSRIFLLFLPQRLYFQAMRYERYIMAAVLLLVLFGFLDGPLSFCVGMPCGAGWIWPPVLLMDGWGND